MRVLITEAANGWIVATQASRMEVTTVIEATAKDPALDFVELLLAVTDVLAPSNSDGYKLMIAALPSEPSIRNGLATKERKKLEQLRDDIERLLDGEPSKLDV